jgi:hypothetical protein
MPDTIHKDLLLAYKQPGCPVCHLEHDAVDQYLQTAFRARANDLAIRQDLRDSLGLCREHAWRMLNLGLENTIAAAIGYHDVLLKIVQQLQHADLTPNSSKRFLSLKKQPSKPLVMFKSVVKALTPRHRCPACNFGETFSRSILRTLIDSLQEQDMHGDLASSEGLCLPHLRQLFEQMQDADMCKELISMNVERVETLRRKLSELIRQIEQHKDRKIEQDEKDTWKVVINTIAGER